MIFRWNDWNIEKVTKHGVSPFEAEYVVEHAAPPYPEEREGERLLVWGAAQSGRRLQVIYLLDDDRTVFVIHARALAKQEKRRLNRRLRRTGRR